LPHLGILKLQHFQNKVLRTTAKFTRSTPVCDFPTAFQVPYVYYYVIKLCGQQAEVIRNHENANVCDIEKGEAQHRKYKRFKLASDQAYNRLSDKAAVVA
jgi:hypothetical protein